MSSMTPIAEVQWADTMSRAAMDLVLDHSAGTFSASFNSAESFFTRVNTYGQNVEGATINVYTKPMSERSFAGRLIEGLWDKVGSASYKYIGIYCGCNTSSSIKQMCAVSFATNLPEGKRNYTTAEAANIPKFPPAGENTEATCNAATSGPSGNWVNDNLQTDRPEVEEPTGPCAGNDPHVEPNPPEDWKTMSTEAFHA